MELLVIVFALCVVVGGVFFYLVVSNKRIDATVKRIDDLATTVEKASREVLKQELESERNVLKGKLEDVEKNIVNLVDPLRGETAKLRRILSNNQARGNFGERTTEDILKHFGLKEGVNYTKQNTEQVQGGRPDFTFIAPKGHGDKELNLDVKFPFQNYQRCVAAEDTSVQKNCKRDFKADIRKHIRDVSERSYINENTVPYVLLLIPNEAIYQFMAADEGTNSDPGLAHLFDEALKKKVLMISPIMLFGILSMFRDFLSLFRMESQGREVKAAVERFYLEWGKYYGKLEELKKQLSRVQKSLEELTGARTNKLQKAIDQIKALDLGEQPEEEDAEPVEKESEEFREEADEFMKATDEWESDEAPPAASA